MEYYSITEVADKLKVDHKTIRAAIKNGDLEAIMIGGQYRISEEQLQDYLKKRTLSRNKRKTLILK